MENRVNIVEALRREVYSQPALVPISPWLDSVPPEKPKVYTGRDGSGKLRLAWEKSATKEIWLWLVQTKVGADWTSEILPGNQSSTALNTPEYPRFFAVSAVDRCGNASLPSVLELQEERVSRK
jgi:hypothetical protein